MEIVSNSMDPVRPYGTKFQSALHFTSAHYIAVSFTRHSDLPKSKFNPWKVS